MDLLPGETLLCGLRELSLEPEQPCRGMMVVGEEHCVYVWHRSKALLSFLPQPPMMGHTSCRHMESVICGELRRLIADGGASVQLGMRQTRESGS